jgi:DNA processing protein
MRNHPPGTLLSPEQRLDWLQLSAVETVGPITFRQLIDRYGSADVALRGLPHLIRRGGSHADIRIPPRAEASAWMEAAEAAGGCWVAWPEPGYPPLLREIVDAPPLVSIMGDTTLPTRPTVAIVGARNASANGRRVAQLLAKALGRSGMVVVSGLARGIDAAAHRAALATGTIAAVAGGFDRPYPEENAQLHRDIARQGLILAEDRPGTAPRASHFPRRNRLIAGLSLGVVVIEAAERSGSLITARSALDQGREVFAVPGSPLDPRSRGGNRLIKDGATLVEDVDDVLDALSISRLAQLRTQQEPMPAPSEESTDSARHRVLELLGPNPVTVDELVRQCQLSAPDVLAVLLESELAGHLERHPGNHVSKRYDK